LIVYKPKGKKAKKSTLCRGDFIHVLHTDKNADFYFLAIINQISKILKFILLNKSIGTKSCLNFLGVVWFEFFFRKKLKL